MLIVTLTAEAATSINIIVLIHVNKLFECSMIPNFRLTNRWTLLSSPALLVNEDNKDRYSCYMIENHDPD